MLSRAERGECSALHDGGPVRERSGGGIFLQIIVPHPLYEGTPPYIEGEFKVYFLISDSRYIIAAIPLRLAVHL